MLRKNFFKRKYHTVKSCNKSVRATSNKFTYIFGATLQDTKDVVIDINESLLRLRFFHHSRSVPIAINKFKVTGIQNEHVCVRNDILL